MTQNVETKVCPLCAESIKADAKVCPHCRHWQKKWSLQNPSVGTTLVVVLLIVLFVALAAFCEKVFGRKEPFEAHRHEFSIVSSQFSHRVAASNLWLTVVGTVTNRGDRAWKSVGVEVRFYDQAGKMIDVIAVDGESYRGVALLPHSDAGFKVQGKAARPVAEYGSYKASIRWGKEADAWP